MFWYFLITAVVFFIFGYLVCYRNPNIDAVNKLIAAGDAVVKTTADGVVQITKKL